MIATLALPGAEKALHPGTKLDLQAGLPSGTGSGAPGLLAPPHPGTPSIVHRLLPPTLSSVP